MTISSRQSRAARGLLRWKQRDLAKHAGLTPLTVTHFESEEGDPKRSTILRIEKAFRDAGVVFLAADDRIGLGEGVRLITPLKRR
jgi:transcriptional regulator with XRE-family HTH domain